MSQEIYHGVPRNKTPWGPTINYEKCTGCEEQCLFSAITFPCKRETRKLIRKLRKTPAKNYHHS